jgi:uncharacterized RDD family membrane protein YckC
MSGRGASRGASFGSAQSHATPSGRAAAAAARVAARYAKAPSYSEMLAREARAAVDAAKAAAKAAEDAQAAFQYVLDGLEAGTPAEPAWKLEPLPERKSESRAAPAAAAPPHRKAPELPRGQLEPAVQEPAIQELAIEEPANAFSWELEAGIQQNEPAGWDVGFRSDSLSISEVDTDEPGEIVNPIYANLIEFPRPMVATRRARPRRAEGPLAEAATAPQLSIFEVDTAAISIAPPPATVDASAPPEWMRTEWPALSPEENPPSADSAAKSRSMDLALRPLSRNFRALPPAMNVEDLPLAMDLAAQANLAARPGEELAADLLLDEPVSQPAPAPAIEPAALSRRLLATVVDGALIAAAVVAAALLAARYASQLPGVRTLEFGTAIAMVATGLAYYAGILTLTWATPGMWYAGIEIESFSGFRATRGQRCGRLMAMLLSVLPLGLGFVWALFDDEGLAWHDRLSKTYLRKR